MATNVGPTPNSETITLNEPGTDVEKSAQAPTQGPDHNAEVDSSDPYCCQLAPEDDPKHLPSWRKWLAVFAISSSSMCATFASSVVRPISLLTSCRLTPVLTGHVPYEPTIGGVHGGGARARLAYGA